MAQVGRISGPLLEANLLRQGIANNTQQNLSFKNTNSDTTLLKVDVVNGRIGVDVEAPANELQISQTIQTTDLLVPSLANIANFEITDSTFRILSNDLYLNASEAVVFTTLDNGTIVINDNTISTVQPNADIDLTPNGTGTTEIINDLNVFGSIYTPGNITFDGTITFGDADTDNVTFESDINSDIIPDSSDAYNLGQRGQRWSDLYTNFVNGSSATTNGYVLSGIDLLTRHGGVIYVSQEGSDDHVGDHFLDPLATISEALSRAEASGEQPFTIIVSAGEYQEALPLVVPSNVSIVGSDIRNTVIMPDTNSQSEDVFHLNDKTLIANLTIKNHYYNSINNTGYAFRFAPDAVMSERSPYIQNITVLTAETSNGAGDAGRGAWIDGDELNAATVNKTMLFHSCTFISPGADVINMTNDVRVEWLNSFTYYANRGLYAFAGANGGAELRSIGSANVYGNYGAVADGADTLMYLIQHNFGYIGAGNKNDNNEADAIQANEIVELNSGQIHYVSTDQVGNFRVGDNFFVNTETGNTSLSINSAEIDSLSGLNINSPGGNTTVISGSDIQTGNIIISNNTIDTPVGDLNLEGATGTININSDTNVFGSVDIRDNFSFGGTLNIAGNQPGRNTDADKFTFNVDLEQDFKPHVTLTHSLGEDVRPWNTAWLDRAEIDDITIDENYITTDISNANLDLRSTNRIYVPSNNIQINNNLTVDGATNIQSIDITGDVNYVGDRTQTGNFNIAGEISNGSIEIEDNFIHTIEPNTSLEIRASGSGKVLIPNNSVQINNNLTVSTDTDLQSTTITGSLLHTGDRIQTGQEQEPFLFNVPTNSAGPYTYSYISRFDALFGADRHNINIFYKGVQVYSSGTNSGNGSLSEGEQFVGTDGYTYEIGPKQGDYGATFGLPDNDVNNIDEYFSVQRLGFLITGDTTYNLLGEFTVDNVYVEDNFITTTSGNLILGATGNISINDNVEITQTLTVNSTTSLQNTNITGNITQTGNYTQIGNSIITGDATVTQDLDVSQKVQFEEILFDDNYITTTTTNTDLELRANGTGKILIPNNNVQVNNNISASNIFNNNNVNITLQSAFNEADVSDITITQNYISTNNGNLDLLLRANGTGIINIEDAVLIDNDFTGGNLTSLRNSRTIYKYGPELVKNGTFDTNLNFWSQTGGGSANDVNGNLQINATGAARNVSQGITVEVGKTYDFKAQFRSVSNGNPFYLRIFESGIGTLKEWNETSNLSANEYLTYSFIPQTTSIDIIFRAVDTVVAWDNVSIIEDIGLVTENTPVEVDYLNLTQTGDTTQTGNITQTGDVSITENLLVSNEIDSGNININANIIRNFGEGLRPSNASNEVESLPRIVQAIINGSTADDFAGQTEKTLVNFLIDNNYIDVNQSGTQTTTDYISYLRYISNGSTGDTQEDIFIKSVFDEIIDLEIATPGTFNSILFDGDYFNPDLELRAAGTGKVVVSNTDVNVATTLSVLKTFSTDSLATSLTSNLLSNNIIISDTTKADDNYLTTVVSNANLELRAFENKLVYIPNNDVTVEQNLTVNGNTDIDNVSIVGNILQTGNRTQLGNMNVVGTVTVSTSNIQDDLQLEDVLIDRNIIETQDSNADLELVAQGAGVIEIPGNDVQVDTNLNVTNINTSNISINNSFSFDDFELSSNIQIFDNVITTTSSNSNLELRPSEGNNIVLQELFLNADTLSTINSNITFNVSDNLTFDSTGAVIIPTGTALEDQNVDSGLRFNSTDNRFQAYKNNNLVTFGGIYSTDTRTSVLADPTNNILTFRANNLPVASINSSSVALNKLNIDNIRIDNNLIQTDTNIDLDLRANGTGKLTLDNITISQGTILNNAPVLTFENRLYGAVKFTGNSVALPYGTTATRPINPEIGTSRWNTDTNILEVWDGTQFITSAGSQESISQSEMDDLILEYTLIFG